MLMQKRFYNKSPHITTPHFLLGNPREVFARSANLFIAIFTIYTSIYARDREVIAYFEGCT